jgi:hypothetical protein
MGVANMTKDEIIEMAKQAKLPVQHSDWIEGYERFAALVSQLIVRECISKCEFVADIVTVTNSGEMARKTKATADSCAAMIKEHFGVEL